MFLKKDLVIYDESVYEFLNYDKFNNNFCFIYSKLSGRKKVKENELKLFF